MARRARTNTIRPRLELLESRRLLASISGTVAVDTDADFAVSDGDSPVSGAFVWVDSNQSGQYDQGEPSTRTDADGNYQFNGLAEGTHTIRYRPKLGMFQTSPAEYFAFQRDTDTDLDSIVTIDLDQQTVTRATPAAHSWRSGLIKTVDGIYFSAAFRGDVLYRIDPTTGEETLVGYMYKEIVGGLAYDPIMDQIYTLARDTDEGDPAPPLRLFKVNRETAALTPVSDHLPELAGIKYTTSLAFDWVNREIVLYDNLTDAMFAYDLEGRARQLSVPGPKPFFNLAFDGHRFLAVYYQEDQALVGEVDIDTATLTPIAQLNQRINSNAGDILAQNHPHQVAVPAADSIVTGVDFLSGKMKLKSAELTVGTEEIRLKSTHLDISEPLDPMNPGHVDLAIDSADLNLSISATTSSGFSVTLDDGDNHVNLSTPLGAKLELGAGLDTVRFETNAQFDTTQSPDLLTGVDVFDLTYPLTVELKIDADAVGRISDANHLVVYSGAEDIVDIGSSPWQVHQPVIVGNDRVHLLTVDAAVLQLVNQSGWRNPADRLDVNHDGEVTPLDALVIINLLARTTNRSLEIENVSVLDADYVDTNGDNFLSARDALRVINGLVNPQIF